MTPTWTSWSPSELDDTCSVFRYDGSGDFAEARLEAAEAAGSLPVSTALADLDGDGDLDLTTANLGSTNVTVLRSGGRGRLHSSRSASPVPVGLGNPRALTAANLDADGDVDRRGHQPCAARA